MKKKRCILISGLLTAAALAVLALIVETDLAWGCDDGEAGWDGGEAWDID